MAKQKFRAIGGRFPAGGPADRSDSASDSRVTPRVRDAVSIALVVHLTIVAVSLTSAWIPSPLQLRLLGLFAPYSIPLGLNLQQRQIYLTHGQAIDMPHWVRLLAADGSVEGEIRNPGMWFSERSARRERVATLPVRLQMADNTQAAAALTASFAAKMAPSAEPGETYRLQVLRRIPQPNSAVLPPPLVEEVAYEAAVVVDAQGRMQVTTLEETAQNAMPVENSANDGGSQ